MILHSVVGINRFVGLLGLGKCSYYLRKALRAFFPVCYPSLRKDYLTFVVIL